ncbi:MAG: methyltransferase domain-containing protein [Methylococcales bacterium]|nr:methyltransferase domain-containing protein [Methylococcales bacterium]MDD5630713.1 methyltransferase domain-containing protein [Methylococcales bacterium]
MDPFYLAFEDRYRGTRELIALRLEVYLPFVQPFKALYETPEILDLGCGRGEWLELMQKNGFLAKGVDLDEGMLLACRELNLNVCQADALDYLRKLEADSLTVVSAFHVVEHIPFETLRQLVGEAYRVLKPGGLLILETPNSENLVVGTSSFYLDPTHQKPLPAKLLTFVVEYAEFERVKTLYLQEHLDLATAQKTSLFDVLAGVSPDYSIVAQKKDDPEVMELFDRAFKHEYGISLDYLANAYDRQVDATITQLETKIRKLAAFAEAQAQKAEVEAQKAEAQAQQAAATLQTIYASRSWLITSPLGWVRAHLGKTRLMLKNGVAQAYLSAVAPVLQPYRPLMHKLSIWLLRHFPEIHYRLRSQARRKLSFSNISSGKISTSIVSPSQRVADVLSDPAFLTLERPVNLSVNATSISTIQEDFLEPLVELNQMRQSATSICFVVFIDKEDPVALESTIQSVLRQTDPSWEILLFACEGLEKLAEEWLDIDWRVRRYPDLIHTGETWQLVVAAGLATTDFIGLLSQGDVADDDVVKLISKKVRDVPDAEVIYTDEWRLLENGTLGLPFYKPDWSPEHQFSVNYVGRFTAIRKKLLLDIVLPEKIANSAAEYSLILEATRRAKNVVHIDDALYIRHVPEDIAIGGYFSATALADARKVLERYVHMENPDALVIADTEKGALQVTWPVPQDSQVTLLILTGMYKRNIEGRGEVILATNFVDSIIKKTSFKDYKIIIVDDGFVPDDLQALLLANGHESYTYKNDGPFSFANKANFATSLVPGGLVILLNDDLEIISPDWIQALAGQAARKNIGAVGAKLLFADGLIQHAGIVIGFHGTAGHIFHRTEPNGQEYGGFASIERNYSAVTGAVLAYRKEVFDEVGGFDERFKTDYNDIDFCLRCIEAGYRIVYTPASTLYHFHNSSFKRNHDNEIERVLFLERWGHVVARDPLFSKHFQKQSQDLPLLIW